MFLKCTILLFLSACIDAQYPYGHRSPLCSPPHLDHGRVRVRQRSKLVKFMCSFRYELVGNRYATCINGEWDVPMPVCVRSGCPERPIPENALQSQSHHNAWVVTFCLPGYKLKGDSAVYCNGFKWNATNPTCVASRTKESNLSCDFEDPDICGWKQDELHDFDWKRLNKKTPSSFLYTGPSYDHTLGQGNAGHYMYIESTSRYENDTARLLSPVYDVSLTNNGCFSFFYHMFGVTIGGLRVYQKPDSLPLNDMLNLTETAKAQYILFEQWGNLGDVWYSAAPPLKKINEDFQIVLEGIRGKSFTSDIAIDDVAILQGINCTYFRNAATTPAPLSPYGESCVGRCKSETPMPANACGCFITCIIDENCCADYMEVCVYSNATSDTDDPSPSDAPPQTEKLVGETTTVVPSRTTDSWSTTTTTTTTTTRKPSTRTSTTTRRTTTTAKPTSTSTRPTTTKTTPKITTKRVTTTKPPTTTKVVTTTQKVTTEMTKRPSVKTKTVVVDPIMTKIEEKKSEKEMNVQRMIGDKPKQNKSSTWKTPVITIVVLSVFAALIYLGVAARTTRGRVAIARIRGRLANTHDSEVRYLNSNDDEDL